MAFAGGGAEMSSGGAELVGPGWNDAGLSGSVEPTRDELSFGTARSIPETDAVFHENAADEFVGLPNLDGTLGDLKTIRLDCEALPSSVGLASSADWSSEAVGLLRQFLLPWETSHLAPIFGGSEGRRPVRPMSLQNSTSLSCNLQRLVRPLPQLSWHVHVFVPARTHLGYTWCLSVG